jgi:hypothetical protein
LARRGALAEQVKAASDSEYARLYGGAYEIVWPIVFDGLTRRIEYGRGHHRCTRGVEYLESDCLDRFEDDVEAVVDYVFRNAKVAIHNLDGWIRRWLTKATVDGHRRRRGERGALQRPRTPKWLATRLGDDPWLIELARRVLTWVGVPATAGGGLWPYGAWLERRVARTGDMRTTEQDVAADVETVLAAMRENPAWYEKFVEGPLGRKRAPLLPGEGPTADPAWERPPLALIQRHESDDALLRGLAGAAIEVMQARLARGEDRRTVVAEVIRVVFGGGAGAEYMDQAPGAGPGEDERVRALLADAAAIDRIVSQVRDILDGGHERSEDGAS